MNSVRVRSSSLALSSSLPSARCGGSYCEKVWKLLLETETLAKYINYSSYNECILDYVGTLVSSKVIVSLMITFEASNVF